MLDALDKTSPSREVGLAATVRLKLTRMRGVKYLTKLKAVRTKLKPVLKCFRYKKNNTPYPVQATRSLVVQVSLNLYLMGLVAWGGGIL